MPVVTLEGYLGSGYQNIGRKVSENLDIDFVDRVILSEVARELDTHLGENLDLEKKPQEKSIYEIIWDEGLTCPSWDEDFKGLN